LKRLSLDIHIKKLLQAFGQDTLLNSFNFLSETKIFLTPTCNLKQNRGLLGQLALKSEAAGKIRVFAMVDV